METYRNKSGAQITQINPAERKVLSRIIKLLGPFAKKRKLLPKIGRYKEMSAEHVWLKLVVQVCVMGKAGLIVQLMKDKKRYKDFKRKVSLRTVRRKPNPASYLATVLSEFKATRFHPNAADKLAKILKKPSQNLQIRDLPHRKDTEKHRQEIMNRFGFGLKSASDFMITVGLSRDVIALDTRVVGMLKRHFGYNVGPHQVQNSRKIYVSLEDELRKVAQGRHVSLALLDRLLFQFNDLTASYFFDKQMRSK